MSIRILDAATVGRIAAGEVVERPSSACKELMENSLDADSTSITVEMRGGGVDYLRVTDNGKGIAPAEVKMAFENHATSKLLSADQLSDIRTLGFRGEALPSIASVSRVTVTTRRRDADSGVKLTIEGGRLGALVEAGCPEGTTIVVEDMFFNVPARRAFLKKASIEAGAIQSVVSALALANPGVSVRLISNEKTILHTFGDNNLRHAALAIYGKDIASKLTAIDQMDGAFRIEGLIGTGDIARPTRAEQHFFINGRVVKCALLTRALEEACAGRVTIGMHPICMLSLTLPPHAVDVNVHPNKLEVRFRDEPGVRHAVAAMFERAFASDRMFDVDALTRAAEPVMPEKVLTIEEPTSVSNNSDASADSSAQVPTSVGVDRPSDVTSTILDAGLVLPSSLREGVRARPVASNNPFLRPQAPADPPPMSADARQTPAPPAVPEPAPYVQPTFEQIEAMGPIERDRPQYRVIGVALKTYLLVEAGETLILIDQHAAHERILYEQYARKLEDSGASQQLLTPIILPANAREMAQIEQDRDLLTEAGYDVQPFDERTIAVRAVPFVLGQAEMRALFMDMIERLDRLKYATRDRRRAEIIQMSCKHAVKGGDRLTDGEIEELLSAMEGTQSPATCPHGRPVCRVLTKNELERMFKRQQ